MSFLYENEKYRSTTSVAICLWDRINIVSHMNIFLNKNVRPKIQSFRLFRSIGKVTNTRRWYLTIVLTPQIRCTICSRSINDRRSRRRLRNRCSPSNETYLKNDVLISTIWKKNVLSDDGDVSLANAPVGRAFGELIDWFIFETPGPLRISHAYPTCKKSSMKYNRWLTVKDEE